VILRIILRIVVAVVLTIISQVGGIIYIICLAGNPFLNKKIPKWYWRTFARGALFVSVYFLSIFFIVPPLARQFGRIRLPVSEENHVRPLLTMTWLLNRNYVITELRDAVFKSAGEMDRIFPGSKVVYLDANFPFWDGFPLFPHLSHNDGKKIDIAFLYRDTFSGLYTSDHPSIIGYGVCEEPRTDEVNTPLICEKKGFWQYNMLRRVVPQARRSRFEFDNERTSTLVSELCSIGSVSKIFIEPHLIGRLGLTNSKIRFHGCQAVRHDDHIHVQVK
jgi:hypothetical protein